MIEEMTALHDNGTWDLVPLPKGKTTIGCHWIFTVKVGSGGAMDRLKERLVSKDTLKFMAYYVDTLSPVAKIVVGLLIVMEIMNYFPPFQLTKKEHSYM